MLHSNDQHGFFCRYSQYQYDSSQSNYSPTVQTLYNSNYSHLESPEKVNSLDRNKKNLLQSQINSLDTSVYGSTTNNHVNYDSFSKNAPSFAPPRPPAPVESKLYSPSYQQFSPTSPKNLSTFDYPRPNDGYSTSEYTTNSYKIPGGYKTEQFKYEAYKSSPTYQSGTEKYFTSTPNSKLQVSPYEQKSFDTFKNGSDSQYQSSFSSNVEYINEPPVLKDSDTLEQKMLKKSVTQQIIEKKTVQTTKSSRQESSTRSFKFE